jgi:glycerol-3-phosphate dehydrogenase (NAD(P)+)
MSRVAILGSGAWGTTLAVVLARKGTPVTLWDHAPGRAEAMQRDRVNAAFLPGIAIPSEVTVTADLAAALAEAEDVVFVTPSQRMRANARQAAQFILPTATIVSCTKGLEQETLARMSQVVHAELPEGLRDRVAALSGPNLAREIAEGKLAACVVASQDNDVACHVQAIFNAPTLRMYTSDDVIGVELGGTLKNIIAIAIGCVDGLGLGDNTKATLMTRGLAEILRLTVAEGGHPMTVAGLAGLGDLIATCSSPLSRNYTLGRDLAATGKPLAELLATRHTVAEGVPAARAAVQMAARHNLAMPIAEALCRLFDGEEVHTLIAALMQRELRPERDSG